MKGIRELKIKRFFGERHKEARRLFLVDIETEAWAAVALERKSPVGKLRNVWITWTRHGSERVRCRQLRKA